MRSDAIRRRNSLIEAGMSLLIRDGKDMTLESVAEKAGVGIATLYRNFPTRNDLVHSCIIAIADRGIAELKRIANNPPRDQETALNQLNELVSLITSVGLNILIPALVQPEEKQLPPDFVRPREALFVQIRRIDENLRATGLIHSSISGIDFYTGIIALCAPPHFEMETLSVPSTKHLINIYLAGCRAGISGKETPSSCQQ
ncbi:TetR/AcrR family transcriptional regulator [Corynebacterium pseudotuberculosis]|uniref:TetR family transcriptional regulator n=1 Tax=Corynebacterium pseudotuberculosis (strain C231) TaxID=681645 RepID=D9QAQ4_CORP2|nr:TetR/AcrR family transcriptional regulator [Corynebacterium pseudotuberculosis]ADK28951.1 TetR family transcriptional regulator [Corynebacterium pseudotuberculosis FRC41]ADL10630.1 TetR family transcriptional regulator [Corynebacterium pseudotuberculosis C231]ADL21039.1 TetR/AcrR family transcriptional regulator [Corynebacterium pseudotuberculosis 1002]ADO26429.1 TetR family transcriptional regulator [Corynebacterium pseudotuberculosis I19]AEK92492.1 HTH-type transcriptional repressor KstR 